MSDEFSAELIERCVIMLASGGYGDIPQIDDCIAIVLRESGYAELEAENHALRDLLTEARPHVARAMIPYKEGWIEEKEQMLSRIDAAVAAEPTSGEPWKVPHAGPNTYERIVRGTAGGPPPPTQGDEEMARKFLKTHTRCCDYLCPVLDSQSCGCFDDIFKVLHQARDEATKAENEACALTADGTEKEFRSCDGQAASRLIAAAIRARSVFRLESEGPPEGLGQEGPHKRVELETPGA